MHGVEQPEPRASDRRRRPAGGGRGDLPPARRASLRPDAALVARAAPVLAVVLWLLSLRHVDLAGMRDLGLLQVLPWTYWAAAAVLTIGFVCAVRDRRITQRWLAGYVIVLIAIIHATPTLLYPTLRYSWAWKHVAIIDALLRYGWPVPRAGDLSIYNQWPGFFAANAAFLRVTGIHSALSYASWAPPVFNALLLIPLLLLYRSVTTDRTLVWGGVWIYYCASWVGQDYFAPQATAFVLYVAVLALVFRRLPFHGTHRARVRHRWWHALVAGESPVPAPGSRSERRGRRATVLWFVLVVAAEAAIIVVHPLTPLMLISALLLLCLPRRNRRVVLPVFLAAVALTLLWDATVARPYISANLGSFIQALTTPDANATSGLANTGTAAAGQVLVDWVDRLLTAGVLLLAVLGTARRPWARRSGMPLLLLSPFLLVLVNSYGGEILFRVYLFALPAAAFLASALLFGPRPERAGRAPAPGAAPDAVPAPSAVPRGRTRERLHTLTVGVILLGLLGGLFFAYDSKEAMNYFTPQEVAASQFLTSRPAGSTLVAVTGSVPGIEENYPDHTEIVMANTNPSIKKLFTLDPVAGVNEAVAEAAPNTPAYLIVSRAQAAECLLTGVFPVDTISRLRADATQASGYTLVYQNADAEVFRFTVITGARP
ncbi:glycosyltransferase [Streptacidiphilus melanogenes]|uniref:glycosyltransferase n=1 Tax=Streptacidiphilus melanogenes TaxID=411235 RepID=UPI00126A5E51|nr:glycosyltransferase [Streptacidiphilus melanogenes]